MDLKTYLNNKPVYYKKIDYTRFPRAFASVKDKIALKNVIQIVGTNGKGSTGRFLTQILQSCGLKVGHYTSPHVFSFNERFYLNGEVGQEALELAHNELFSILSDEFRNSLSYFEYATLLAGILFKECDYVVLEAGMGAEYDATSQYPKILSLFTPIGTDHLGMLGNSLEEISRTKLISMDKVAILSDMMDEIPSKIAFEIALQKGTNLKFANEILDENDIKNIQKYIQSHHYANFQISNLSLAFAAAKFLNFQPNIDNLGKLDLRGRCEKIAKNIWVDVGHNELAAREILNEFRTKKIVLIYNAFADKDIKSIFEILKPIIKRVEILDYKVDDRALGGDEILGVLDTLKISYQKFKQLNQNEDYLVFGSFHTVENFLKGNY